MLDAPCQPTWACIIMSLIESVIRAIMASLCLLNSKKIAKERFGSAIREIMASLNDGDTFVLCGALAMSPDDAAHT